MFQHFSGKFESIGENFTPPNNSEINTAVTYIVQQLKISDYKWESLTDQASYSNDIHMSSLPSVSYE